MAEQSATEARARADEMLAKATTRDEVLGLALGAASMCWENVNGAGVFESARAQAILQALSARLEEMDEAVRPLIALHIALGGPVQTPALRVVSDILGERIVQYAQGYTPEHDDEHGLEHIVSQARGRLLPQQLRTRDDLVEAAACLVAGIEWMDRQASPMPPEVTA